MINNLEVGQVTTGKVTGIQSYGAFVAISDEIQGLVHISEITHGFVKDINDHLSVGDEVDVKIVKIDEANNKLSLSIRATEEQPDKQPKSKKAPMKQEQPQEDTGFNTLKNKLEEWIEQSTERENIYKN
ncbi:S1 domain-containing post-transcriptional regulator GSP13 [Virgibacillus sp. W0181]|uniref:S1 domain-containing post-transcriptional regulator GSP13 n=1 Tax=Virgibacillus sp. W0181 TaxID=3391581 RepID=UPI003F471720